VKPKPKYRVLVCDDAGTIHQNIHQVLVNDSGFQVVDEVRCARDCSARAVELKPDIVLMNVGSPNLDGAEAVRQVVLAVPGIKVLAYSSDSGWETVERMLGAGAVGYVVNGNDLDELVRAAKTVLIGGHYLSLVLLEPTHCKD